MNQHDYDKIAVTLYGLRRSIHTSTDRGIQWWDTYQDFVSLFEADESFNPHRFRLIARRGPLRTMRGDAP